MSARLDGAALGRRLGVPVALYGVVDSTMTAAERDPRAPVVHLAAEQRAGQGRHGRAWESPPGNLYATVVWPEGDEPFPPALLAAIQVAWAEAIAAAGGPTTRCKWPNDGLIGDGKWSGVLARRVAGEDGPRLLLGLGANLERAPRITDAGTEPRDPEAPPSPAPAALRDHWAGWPGAETVGTLLLSVAIDTLRGGGAAIRANLGRWPRHDALELGSELRVDTPQGSYLGRYQGLDPEGRLRLEVEGRELAIAAGSAHAVRRL